MACLSGISLWVRLAPLKVSQIKTSGIAGTRFIQAGCPSCRPTNSVKALKGKKEEVTVDCI